MRKLLIAATAVLMMASIAAANGPGGDHGSGGDHGVGGAEAHAIVGSDGTLYLTSAATANGTTTVTVKAIRSNGSTAWTATLPAGARGVELSDGNLLAVVETHNSDGTYTSTLTAISTATGNTAWTKTFSGIVRELVPFSGGTYLFVTVPAATSGGTATRSIVAIDNNGNTLWTVTL
jgi:hypothetical protein